ncbi:MAG: NTP transferase domain-containing protein, partial [Deltaproteobacteria bacterium]|nr:NTP transferase domain-containing protein [Deltaproteobacteria bacterium]
MKAMIFAAGFGKRLQPLTFKTPKALVKVKNRPMLDWVVDNLIHHGISEIIINTHYLHSKVHSYLKSNRFSVPITVSHEEIILGTGCGLYQTRQFWNE